MIKAGTTDIVDVKNGTTQIAKVMCGNDLIWENWRAWTITNSSSTYEFTNDYSVYYTIPNNIQVSYIECKAGVYAHTSSETPATVKSHIYIDGVEVAESEQGVASVGNWAYKTITYTPTENLQAGTVIRLRSGGTSYKRSVEYTLVGLQK